MNAPLTPIKTWVTLLTWSWWLGNCRLNCAWPVNCISIVMPSAVCRWRLSLHVARPIEGCNCNKTTTTTYRQQQQRHLTSARVPCECLADESCSSAHSHCKVIQESDKKKYCKKLHYISALTSWLSKCLCVCVLAIDSYAYVLFKFSMTSPCCTSMHKYKTCCCCSSYWFYTPWKYLLNHVVNFQSNFIVQLARVLELVAVTSISCWN